MMAKQTTYSPEEIVAIECTVDNLHVPLECDQDQIHVGRTQGYQQEVVTGEHIAYRETPTLGIPLRIVSERYMETV